MWKRVLELEQSIINQRVDLAKKYMASQGVDTSELSANDLLSIYSCMVIKMQKAVDKEKEM